jgi:hypothetical protein
MKLGMFRRVCLLLFGAITLMVGLELLAGTRTRRQPAPRTTPSVPQAPTAIQRLSQALIIGHCLELNNICYQDAEGKWQYWTDFGKVFSEEVRERQQRYNIWVNGLHLSYQVGSSIDTTTPPGTYPEYPPRERILSGRAITLPTAIRESGRLDQDTIAIPLDHGVYRLLMAASAFKADCEHDAGTDHDSKQLCERIMETLPPREPATSEDEYERSHHTAPPSVQELQRFDANFRLRIAALQQAFAKSAELARALDAVLRSSGIRWQDLVKDGVNPDQLSADSLRAMEAADAALTVALNEVDWTANAYRNGKGQQKVKPPAL